MRIQEEVWRELDRIQELAGKEPSADLAARLDKVVEDCKENSDNLVAYELERFHAQVASVRKSLQPKPRKFQFKSRLVGRTDPQSTKVETKPEVSETTFETAIITRPRNNLDGCVVHEPSTIPTLSLSNIRNSILVLPHVTSALYLTSIQNCVVITECHQFRLHKSENATIYIGGCDNPIIESSTQIKFGHSIGSPWTKVSDFAWLQDTPSPNWTPTNAKPDLKVDDTKLASWLDQLRSKSPCEIIK